jgi:hypothetical protein
MTTSILFDSVACHVHQSSCDKPNDKGRGRDRGIIFQSSTLLESGRGKLVPLDVILPVNALMKLKRNVSREENEEKSGKKLGSH